ncbi:MAG: molybdopterin molybdenumtransferase MoeA, partial [Pseudomonadota bacterium]
MADARDQLIPAEQALEIVLSDVKPKAVEIVNLEDANGRILAEDLSSMRTQPPFDASAMDGYAVRQTDIAELPATLKMIGTSRAGEPYTGSIGKNAAVRIFTGAVVPKGADSIVIQENAEASGDTVRVLNGVDQGKFIRKAGLD